MYCLQEGKTALIMASARGHESVVRPLLEMGNKENINYQIEVSKTSLAHADILTIVHMCTCRIHSGMLYFLHPKRAIMVW